ncbi:MAG: dockerin type I domain-containing protein [Pirellulaceae bacterium]
MLHFESLERRTVLSSVPFGASGDDTAEYMLGDVLVTVVLMESDGSIDANLEDWSSSEIESVKSNVQEGLDWWVDLLALQNSAHQLEFHYDFSFADQPVATGYEPINRTSNDFVLWIEDFFSAADVSANGTFSDRIREFNHQQRIAHDTNWAFTIFVVDAELDEDHRFDTNGDFSLSFAFAGGRFFVMTSERPASTVAHESAHMFWAMDEYAGGKSYYDTRGYYNTQNTNGLVDNPDPNTRVRSLMDSHTASFPRMALSPSAMESIGWKDSDGDGIFDVLDVAHSLTGQGSYDSDAETYSFSGSASVNTLPNLNTSGTGNDMTINRIRAIEYRFGEGEWITAQALDDYQATVQFTADVPDTAESIEIRAIDTANGVTSESFFAEIDRPPVYQFQNPNNPLDVNNDGAIAPIDALLVINRLNGKGAAALEGEADAGPPYLDTNGDNFVSAIDALLVINQLNSQSNSVAAVAATNREVDSSTAEGESRLATLNYSPAVESAIPIRAARRRGLAEYQAATDAVFAARTAPINEISTERIASRLRTAHADDIVSNLGTLSESHSPKRIAT